MDGHEHSQEIKIEEEEEFGVCAAKQISPNVFIEIYFLNIKL